VGESDHILGVSVVGPSTCTETSLVVCHVASARASGRAYTTCRAR
jgi:hypothetical protein